MVSNEKDDKSHQDNKKNIPFIRHSLTNGLIIIIFIFSLFIKFLHYHISHLYNINNLLVSLKIQKIIYGKESPKQLETLSYIIFKYLLKNELNNAKKYINEYNDIAEKNGIQTEYNHYQTLIIIYSFEGEFLKAKNLYTKCLSLYNKDEIIKDILSLSYYYNINNFSQSINILEKQISSDKSSINQELKLAYLYFLNNEYNKSKQISYKVLSNKDISIYQELNVIFLLSQLYNNLNDIDLSNFYINLHTNLIDMINCNQIQVLESINKNNFIGIELIKNFLIKASLLSSQKKEKEAEKYYNIIENLAKTLDYNKYIDLNAEKQINDYSLEIYIKEEIASLYLKTNKIKLAEKKYLEILNIRNQYLPGYNICSYKDLRDFYKLTNNRNKIIEFNKLYVNEKENKFLNTNINISNLCKYKYDLMYQ